MQYCAQAKTRKFMDRDIKYLLNHVGYETFVNYFDFYKKHSETKKNNIFFDEFERKGEKFPKRTRETKATNGKRIFKEKREVEALKYIVNDSIRIPEFIRNKAQEILQNLDFIFLDEISEEIAKKHFEGKPYKVCVNLYERDKKARDKCIEHNGVACCVCVFDFEQKYGEIGKGFIHVHHIVPLSEIKEKTEVNPITDLKPVCPNCHAMLHKLKLDIETLKSRIKK